MLQNLPPILKKSAIALVVGSIALGLALIARGPLAYIFTITIGCTGLFTALILYLIFFIKELR